jgi:catechol 2,3-dioxygenase-like lactoylglutathione lyase family enzyme
MRLRIAGRNGSVSISSGGIRGGFVITHVHSVAIVVSDLDRAMKFYRDGLGFEVTADRVDPESIDNRWLTLKPKWGQTNIMLLKPSLPRTELSSRVGKPTYIVFETADIRAECELLKSHNARIIDGPKRAGWGGAIEAHFADPDGNTFLLIQAEPRIT